MHARTPSNDSTPQLASENDILTNGDRVVHIDSTETKIDGKGASDPYTVAELIAFPVDHYTSIHRAAPPLRYGHNLSPPLDQLTDFDHILVRDPDTTIARTTVRPALLDELIMDNEWILLSGRNVVAEHAAYGVVDAPQLTTDRDPAEVSANA